MRIHIWVLVVLLVAVPAGAHETNGPNGGQVVDIGPFHAELAAKGNTVDIYVTDTADKAVPAAGYKGVAILLIGGKSERVVLEAAGGNRLTGTSGVALPQRPKGVIRLTAPDGKTIQAKYD